MRNHGSALNPEKRGIENPSKSHRHLSADPHGRHTERAKELIMRVVRSGARFRSSTAASQIIPLAARGPAPFLRFPRVPLFSLIAGPNQALGLWRLPPPPQESVHYARKTTTNWTKRADP